ncbi:hypothetical protein BJY04DRAFT_215465 [Aspergillus karnatakaensis]|uniref:uncharacterized protein n=1 Tax=Aspergillus karnatakaensis TaxID=1810916 RepID=UPI003CCDEDC9
MATGIEALGVSLALLPLVVNQLDNYARGIEAIRLLRFYKSTLEDVALELGAQHRIFLNNLEKVLDGVVDDDDQGLTAKLGDDYACFFGNVLSAHAMLKRLAVKLEVDLTEGCQTKAPSKRQIVLFLKAMAKAVYDELLQKIRSCNEVLKTLMEQSEQLESRRSKRSPWQKLLPRFRESRKNAEGLFRAIVQVNPLAETQNGSKTVNHRVIFSNSSTFTKDKWNWKEVEFEAYEHHALAPLPNPPLPSLVSHKQRVRFEAIEIDDERNTKHKSCNVPPILDFCSVLCSSEMHIQKPVGFVTDHSSVNIRYNMHILSSQLKPIQLQTLEYALQKSSRRHRLYLAVGLACTVIQYHGTWLKRSWNSADIHLPANDNEALDLDLDNIDDAPPSNLYLPWSITPLSPSKTNNSPRSPLVLNPLLFPLGIALTELSLGKSISTLRRPEDEQGNEDSTRFVTAFQLLNRVQCESGVEYRDAVQSCICGKASEERFWGLEDETVEGRVFAAVVAPLLRNLVCFEGWAGYS